MTLSNTEILDITPEVQPIKGKKKSVKLEFVKFKIFPLLKTALRE